MKNEERLEVICCDRTRVWGGRHQIMQSEQNKCTRREQREQFSRALADSSDTETEVDRVEKRAPDPDSAHQYGNVNTPDYKQQ